MRIGVKALFLIPGALGGTESYLRNLLKAFQEVDSDDEAAEQTLASYRPAQQDTRA